MWDIIDFSEEDLSLTLRSRESMAVFSYPWKEPKLIDMERSEGGAQSINISEEDLFSELALRVRYHGLCRISRLARNGMNGKTPSTSDQMHNEALKFVFRRYQKGIAKARILVDALKASAALRPIPEGLWDNLEPLLTDNQFKTLKLSIETLYIFQEKEEGKWISELIPYLSKALWFQNQFEEIRTGAKQLAIFHQDHPLHQEINGLADKASSMMMREEIEKDQSTRKPWQRGGAGITKGFRVPGKKSRKSTAHEEGEEGN